MTCFLQELQTLAEEVRRKAEARKQAEQRLKIWQQEKEDWQKSQSAQIRQEIQEEDAEMLQALDALADCDAANTCNGIDGSTSDSSSGRATTGGSCRAGLTGSMEPSSRSQTSSHDQAAQMPLIWLLGDVLKLLKGTASPFAAAAWSEPVLSQLLILMVNQAESAQDNLLHGKQPVSNSAAKLMTAIMLQVPRIAILSQINLAAYLDSHRSAVPLLMQITAALPEGPERIKLRDATAIAILTVAKSAQEAAASGKDPEVSAHPTAMDKYHKKACCLLVKLCSKDVITLERYLLQHNLEPYFCSQPWKSGSVLVLRQRLIAQQAQQEAPQQNISAPKQHSKPPCKTRPQSQHDLPPQKMPRRELSHTDGQTPDNHGETAVARRKQSYATATGRIVHGDESIPEGASSIERGSVGSQSTDGQDAEQGWQLVTGRRGRNQNRDAISIDMYNQQVCTWPQSLS